MEDISRKVYVLRTDFHSWILKMWKKWVEKITFNAQISFSGLHFFFSSEFEPNESSHLKHSSHVFRWLFFQLGQSLRVSSTYNIAGSNTSWHSCVLLIIFTNNCAKKPVLLSFWIALILEVHINSHQPIYYTTSFFSLRRFENGDILISRF